VFAASTAATTASSSGTTFFTAMSTSKAFLVAAAAVAIVCVPIGYQLRPSTRPASAKVAQEAQPETKPTVTNTAPTFENSALFAEWRQLHERYGTNAEAMMLVSRRSTAPEPGGSTPSV